ncbi:MAG: methyltransferase domain-containing protein [Holophagaceae bacterium]|nr:methyltransferase domain-containing protein [Holophagaceae bacterium]
MSPSTPEYWRQVYDEEPRPGWDLDGPSPVLAELLEAAAAQDIALGGKIAVPGCGFGHDAAELARRGFRVTAFDFAAPAIEGAKARYGDAVAWRLEDWFTTLEGPFDHIFDHTCFVAMEPARRKDFLDICAGRLRPSGLWLAVLFDDTQGRPGPPFQIAMDEIQDLAAARFEVLHHARAAQSHPRRAGREFLVIGRRKK